MTQAPQRDAGSSSNAASSIVRKPALVEADNSITQNLITQVQISLVLCVLFLVARPKLSWLYTPNVKGSSSHPARPYKGWISWIVPVFSTSDADLLGLVGLDAFVFLQTLKLLFNTFLILAISVLPILCAYYYNHSDPEKSFRQLLLQTSLISLESSEKLVFPCVFCYVVSMFVIYMVYIYYRKYISLRQAYLNDASFATPVPVIKRIAGQLGSIDLAMDTISLPSRTVLLRSLPTFLCGNDDLVTFVKLIGIEEPEKAHLIHDTTRLDRLISKREGIIRRLEASIHEFLVDLNMHSMKSDFFIKNFDNYDPELDLLSNAIEWARETSVQDAAPRAEEGAPGLSAKKAPASEAESLTCESLDTKFVLCKPQIKGADAIGFYVNKLKMLTEEISEQRAIAIKNVNAAAPPTEAVIQEQGVLFKQVNSMQDIDFFSLSTVLRIRDTYKDFALGLPFNTRNGFVTFSDRRTANIVKQSLIGSGTFSCRATAAPPPTDIIWSNINEGEVTRFTNKWVATAVMLAFNLFFYSFVSLLTGAINAESLERTIAYINADLLPLVQASSFKITFNGIVAPLIYNTLLSLAPIIIETICLYEGAISQSELQFKLNQRHGTFLFFNGFLSLLFTAPFMSILARIQNRDFLENIGKTITTSSIFFLNVVIQKTLVGCVSVIVNPGRVAAKVLNEVVGGVKTRREESEAKAPQKINFGYLYPAVLLVFPMVLVYSIIFPVFLAVGAAYFLFSYFVFKSQFLYALESQFESGGVYWPSTSDFIFRSLLVFQIATACQFSVHRGYFWAGMIVPLVVVTSLLGQGFREIFRRRCTYLPLNVQEKRHFDEFISTANLKRKEELKKWEDEEKEEVEAIDLRSLGIVEAEHKTSTYPYKDPSVLPTFSKIILPRWFAITMLFLKKNDKNKVLPL